MKWYSKLIIIFGILVLVVVIAGMIYVVNAKNIMNEYTIQSGAAFNAAMLINAEETFTDPEHAVVAVYGNQRAIVIPENYRSVLYYLRENAGSPIFARIDRGNALTLTVCGSSVFTVDFDPDGEAATVEFTSDEKRFIMRVRGTELRDRLLKCVLEGTGAGRNISLTEPAE